MTWRFKVTIVFHGQSEHILKLVNVTLMTHQTCEHFVIPQKTQHFLARKTYPSWFVPYLGINIAVATFKDTAGIVTK